MSENEPAFSYNQPKHPKLKLRLEDVIFGSTGEVTVRVTADPASASQIPEMLKAEIAGVEIKTTSPTTFEISAADPSPTETPDRSEMVSTATTLTEYLATLTQLDLGMECHPIVASTDTDDEKLLPSIQLKMHAAAKPSADYAFVLANVMLNRLETKPFEALNLHNATGGIETELPNASGGNDYISALYVSSTPHQNEKTAQLAANKLAENAAAILAVNSAGITQERI